MIRSYRTELVVVIVAAGATRDRMPNVETISRDLQRPILIALTAAGGKKPHTWLDFHGRRALNHLNLRSVMGEGRLGKAAGSWIGRWLLRIGLSLLVVVVLLELLDIGRTAEM